MYIHAYLLHFELFLKFYLLFKTDVQNGLIPIKTNKKKLILRVVFLHYSNLSNIEEGFPFNLVFLLHLGTVFREPFFPFLSLISCSGSG